MDLRESFGGERRLFEPSQKDFRIPYIKRAHLHAGSGRQVNCFCSREESVAVLYGSIQDDFIVCCSCERWSGVCPCVSLPSAVAQRCIKGCKQRARNSLLPLLRPSYPHRMSTTPFFLLLLSWLFFLVVSAHALAPPPSAPIHKRADVPPLGFYDPRDQGGSWLTVRLGLRPRYLRFSLIPIKFSASLSFSVVL
jgi:hypothetical protein